MSALSAYPISILTQDLDPVIFLGYEANREYGMGTKRVNTMRRKFKQNIVLVALKNGIILHTRSLSSTCTVIKIMDRKNV